MTISVDLSVRDIIALRKALWLRETQIDSQILACESIEGGNGSPRLLWLKKEKLDCQVAFNKLFPDEKKEKMSTKSKFDEDPTFLMEVSENE